MYTKTQAAAETIKVQSDNGTLRLQFSTKYNPIFGGKRKHQGLGLKDTPENWQKAIAIAYRIEGDLQHPDWQQLFDPTFAKYGLKTKYAAELKLAAPIPEPEPEITVGAMWEDYLIWKQPQLEPTTYHFHYLTTFTNVIKGMVWDKNSREFTLNGYSIWDIKLSELPCFISSLKASDRLKSRVSSALSEAFKLAQSLGKTKLSANPFIIVGGITENKTDKYKSTINADGETQEWWNTSNHELSLEDTDTRAFTKEERDIIIKAFYESDKAATRQVAPLVEFLFLTGCRSGEAFALRWQDVFIGREKNYARFSKSYNGRLKNTQVTKTGEIRLFKIYPKLNDLLLRIKPENAKPTDLVFVNSGGTSQTSGLLYEKWVNSTTTKKGIKYTYPGVVTQLAESGAISCYLSPYHTRHTFITLQAQSGTDLLLLATACGNSVEVIQRHYLGIDTNVEITDI
ncbi:tyrosine-type recombinase/integrase [Microcoleus sp. MON1_C5]|uniref:tyrosine-type recombinase/integrase n=1 Tax=Microcoleus sp. MON1_C5 TaxID=2818828 RepID=UPI002FD1AB41